MQWKIMSKTEAAAETENWLLMERTEFDDLVHHWNDVIVQSLEDDYIKLRKSVLEVHNQCKKKVENGTIYSNKKDYYLDLFFPACRRDSPGSQSAFRSGAECPAASACAGKGRASVQQFSFPAPEPCRSERRPHRTLRQLSSDGAYLACPTRSAYPHLLALSA